MDNVKKFDHPKYAHNYDLEKHVFNILFIMKSAPAIGLLGGYVHSIDTQKIYSFEYRKSMNHRDFKSTKPQHINKKDFIYDLDLNFFRTTGSNMKSPTIVLVHGFWGNALHWQHVIPLLIQQNFKVKAVEIPLTSLADDVERTNKMINQIDGPVLLVGHSYGGAVITEAGNNEKVVGLVYIAAFAPDRSESPGLITQQHPPEAAANLYPDSDGYLWVNAEKYHESFCQDLDPSESIAMAIAQKAPLASTFGDTIVTPAWKTKPSWYQISNQDRMIAPENQRKMAERLNAKEIIELEASHASLASRPNEIADFIIKAASSF